MDASKSQRKTLASAAAVMSGVGATINNVTLPVDSDDSSDSDFESDEIGGDSDSSDSSIGER